MKTSSQRVAVQSGGSKMRYGVLSLDIELTSGAVRPTGELVIRAFAVSNENVLSCGYASLDPSWTPATLLTLILLMIGLNLTHGIETWKDSWYMNSNRVGSTLVVRHIKQLRCYLRSLIFRLPIILLALLNPRLQIF
jgi:hypothetical protein